MKPKILITAILATVLSLTAIAFIPLPKKTPVRKGRPIAIERALYPAVCHGDTIIAYLADAAGNAVTALAVVDSVTPESFYVRLTPPFIELACTSSIYQEK